MAYLAQKRQSSPNFRIIEGGKNKKNNKLLIAITVLFISTLTFLILNNIDNSSGNETVKSAINWDNPPCSPRELSSEWEDITDPRMKANTEDRRYQNLQTNEQIEFHPYNSVHKEEPHWHRLNPNWKNKNIDYYLDKDNNPVGKKKRKAHIYPKCNS